MISDINKVLTDEDIIKAATSIFGEEKYSEVKHETPFGEITININKEYTDVTT